MSEVSRILLSLCGDRNKASSRVRGYWIAEDLEKRGVKCTLIVSEGRAAMAKIAAAIPSHDVIVFQKTYSKYHRWLMAFANRLGKKTILDLDDAPSRTRSPVTLRNVEAMMCNAFAVTVGSDNLLAYANEFQSNSHLIPSSIPVENYTVKEHRTSDFPVCLGWIGNGKHYCDDLVTILPDPLREVGKDIPLRLRIVGACGEQRLYDTFENIPGVQAELIDAIDWSDSDAVRREMAEFDIGLYPLLENDFNKYKCAFKALEYMASGLPVISSDVALNRCVIEHERSGFLVHSTIDWTKAISRLASNSELRRRFGIVGRQKVESQYSVSEVAAKFGNVIETEVAVA